MEPVAFERSRALVLVAICAIAIAACERPERTLRMVRPPLNLDLEIALQMEALIERRSSLDIVLVDPPEAGMSPVEAVAAGHADLAFATNLESYRETVNAVMPMYSSILHVVTATDPPPENLYELFRNHSVYAGPRGSITRQIVRDIAADMDLSGDEFLLTDDSSVDVDVVVLFAPIDRERISSDPRLDGAHLFSLGDPELVGKGSAIDRATLLNPRLRPFVIPVGLYGAVTPEPVLTIAVDNLLVANSDLPAAAVYDLYAEVLRIRPALFGDRPELYRPLDEDIADANWAFSMHPGALDYVRQDEPTFIERYSGVAEVLVTLLIGVISGGYALIRIYRIRRKNRIDRFYVEVIRIRDSVRPDAGETEREAAIAEIRELQDRAFGMLVGEQLAADESFRIFIELTNDAIHRLASGKGLNVT